MALLDRFRKPKKEEPKEEIKKAKKTSKAKKASVAKKPQVKNKKRLAVIYNILLEPHIAEKATALAEKGKYVFKVALGANKIQIKKAVEDLYGVGVVNVQTIKMPPKKKRLGRSEGYKEGSKRGYKKAIVALAEGEKIEIMPR